MTKLNVLIGGAIYKYKLRYECNDFNEASCSCFEEIYKVTYVFWNKCHRDVEAALAAGMTGGAGGATGATRKKRRRSRSRSRSRSPSRKTKRGCQGDSSISDLINDPEFKFMCGIVEIVEILRPLFMIELSKLATTNKRTEWADKLNIDIHTRGAVPSPMYFNFLLHTVKFKASDELSSNNFKRFLEIFFMSSLEENTITGVIPLDKSKQGENEVYEIKKRYVNDESSICNSDIVTIIQVVVAEAEAKAKAKADRR